MVVSFSKKHCGFKNLNFLVACLKINCFEFSHQSHDWPGVYCSFPKLWVPTIFHTGSLELGYQVILDSGVAVQMLEASLDSVVYYLLYIVFFPLFYCCTLWWYDVLWCMYKMYSSFVLMIFIYLLYVVPLRLWDSDIVSRSVTCFLFSPLFLFFLLLPLSSSKTLTVRFFGNEKSRSLHLVSELMVKRQPALLGITH